MKNVYKIIVVAVIVLLVTGCFVIVGKPPHKEHPGKNKPSEADPLILEETWHSVPFWGRAIVITSTQSVWSPWWVIEATAETPVPDPDIEIELMDGWNLISIPLNYSINISSVCIVFNNETYTWDEAINNQMVLLFLYSWDADNQMYALSDQFEPGMGYWFYSFESCQLVVR